ncbi:ABC transporter ATP-binding protein, partial [Rhizobiaceae sp. 2RAB30]
GGGDELPVAVSFAEELGDVTYIHGKTPAGSPVIIRSDRARFAGQGNCTVELDAAGAKLFDADGRRLRESGV